MIANRNYSPIKYNYMESELFQEGATLPVVLKNPNALKEAVIYAHMAKKDPLTIRKFVGSREAKAMIEAGTITYDTLDKLSQKDADTTMNVMVCHTAHENEDELWDELVKARAEERRIMNELLAKYGSSVSPLVDKANEEIINSIPKEFR